MWRTSLLEGGSLTAATGSLSLVSVMVRDTVNQGRTLTRIVGDLWFSMPNTAGFYGLTYGWLVVTDEAFVAGSLPEPRSDEAPWLLHRQWNGNIQAAGERNPAISVPFDIKAQRKLDAQSRIVLILESGGMAGNLNIEMNARILFRLP